MLSPTQNDEVRLASQARRSEHKEDVRQAILAAAAELLLEKGYDGFSLRQVAQRIRYSATTIYLYFQDKDDLLTTLVRERWTRFEQLLGEAPEQHSDPLDRLKALTRAYFEFGVADPVFYRSVFMQRPALLKRMLEDGRFAYPYKLWTQALEEAMEKGLIARGDPGKLADMIWATGHGVIALAVTIPFFTPERSQQAFETTLDAVIKGLR